MSKTRILEIRKEDIIQDEDEDKLTNFDLISDFKSESVKRTLKNVLSPRQFAKVSSDFVSSPRPFLLLLLLLLLIIIIIIIIIIMEKM